MSKFSVVANSILRLLYAYIFYNILLLIAIISFNRYIYIYILFLHFTCVHLQAQLNTRNDEHEHETSSIKYGLACNKTAYWKAQQYLCVYAHLKCVCIYNKVVRKKSQATFFLHIQNAYNLCFFRSVPFAVVIATAAAVAVQNPNRTNHESNLLYNYCSRAYTCAVAIHLKCESS